MPLHIHYIPPNSVQHRYSLAQGEHPELASQVDGDLAKIQQAILELLEADYAQLSRWFHELDWERWDSEIDQDSRDGDLDFLAVQATQAKADGTLREL